MTGRNCLNYNLGVITELNDNTYQAIRNQRTGKIYVLKEEHEWSEVQDFDIAIKDGTLIELPIEVYDRYETLDLSDITPTAEWFQLFASTYNGSFMNRKRNQYEYNLLDINGFQYLYILGQHLIYENVFIKKTN